VLAAAHELAAGAGGVEAARTLLQRGVRMNGERAELWAELWAELVRVGLSFVEGLRRRWDVLGVKVGGEAMAMDVDDEARDEVMRGAIVVIHGTWPMSRDLCLLSSCAHHLLATLTIQAVISRVSRLLVAEKPRTCHLSKRVPPPAKPEGCPCCSTFDFALPSFSTEPPVHNETVVHSSLRGTRCTKRT
jgi:hypothetical protein